MYFSMKSEGQICIMENRDRPRLFMRKLTPLRLNLRQTWSVPIFPSSVGHLVPRPHLRFAPWRAATELRLIDRRLIRYRRLGPLFLGQCDFIGVLGNVLIA
jgi:hypothetical protein